MAHTFVTFPSPNKPKPVSLRQADLPLGTFVEVYGITEDIFLAQVVSGGIRERYLNVTTGRMMDGNQKICRVLEPGNVITLTVKA